MKTGVLVATLLVVPMLVLSAWALTGLEWPVEPQDSKILAEPPDYVSGYGFYPVTQTMEDTNGFRYSYQDDGIIKLDLPWGYTTYFSFGLTADYLGSPEQRTALDYTWTWDTIIGEALNETGNLTGYTYAFTATSDGGNMDWEICLEFSPTSRMKITHTLENDYPSDLTNVKFWYLFDLRGTASPYTIETSAGTVEGPLYQAIPDGIHWVRLANQFQFDWSDALADYENGHAYIGEGSVVGLDGLPILGISIELGDIAPGATIIVDPYFSGVERTWDAAGDASASAPASWDPVGVPATGDNITFDSGSYNCNWNVAVTLGDFDILTGYTGTVTPTVSFGLVDFTMESGTFTGSIVHWLTSYGDWTKSSVASITSSTLQLQMMGGSFTIVSGANTYLLALRISGPVSFSTGPTFAVRGLTIDSEGVLTLGGPRAFEWQDYNGATYYFLNNGIINGTQSFHHILYDASKTFAGYGIIEAPVSIILSGSTAASRTLTLINNVIVSNSLTIYSSHATNTLALIGAGYDLTIDETVTLGNRAIMTQGTGAWSFGSYAQTGEDSVFNQNGTLTIGGDFTVSDGTFHAVGDMTVPGDWDTATGSYQNDDSAVFLTGTAKTLAMNAADSFFNVTVSGSYTMNTDTTVRQRATITGTVDGTGDFLEPEPEFTSVPWVKGCPLELYEYDITQLYWDELAIDSAPYWLNLYDGSLKGIPGENETGIYTISLTLTWNDMITYQNFTLVVCAPTIDEYQLIVLGVALSLVMGFGLLGLAIWRNNPLLMLFSGLVFMFSAVAIYKDINLGWTILSMGLGILFLYTGGLQIANDSES